MTAFISIDQVFTAAVFCAVSLIVLIMSTLLPGVIGPTTGMLLGAGIVVLGYAYVFPAHARTSLLSGASMRPLLSARVLFLCVLPVLLVALLLELWPGMQFARVSGAPKGVALLPIFTGLLYFLLLEEVMFRGVLLPYLSQKYSVHIAVLVQAILFCLAHYLSLRADLPFSKAPFYLVLGIFVGYLTVFTKSLWPAVLAHGLWNMFASFEIWFRPLIMRDGLIHAVGRESSFLASSLALGLAVGAAFLLLRKGLTTET